MKMTNLRALCVGVLGFILMATGLSLWVLGDATSKVVPLPLASTGMLWTPLLWVTGIIVLLSAALAGVLRIKYYFAWILALIVGYLAVFAILVTVASRIIP